MKATTLGTFDNILGEWGRFISSKKHNPSHVRPRIAESWFRCFQAGVSPCSLAPHRSLDAVTLHKVLQEKEMLIKIAKPFMANLYQFVRGSGFVVVLTDENGHIMELFDDEDTLTNPMTQDFFRGASWHEEEAGTNAIGTALVLGEPIQVSGAEHFRQKHHCLTCSAAPILYSDGRIIGILDMSGASHLSHLHTLGMVAAAAEAITAQLNIRRKNQELAIINNRLTNFFNAVSDGVIMIDQNDMVTEINPAAWKIFGHAREDILGQPVQQLFEGKESGKSKVSAAHEPYTDRAVMADTQYGPCQCLASGEPVVNEQGAVTGGIIILRPIKQVQNLVNRFSGYSATLQFHDIIGESVEIREAVRLASLTAINSSNILLQGESGTGKEIFAQAIHNRSAQHAGPFIALNCGAIPRELIGSELFGYEEGAFTGAKRGGKPGKFELAAGGTLFLDEIGDMPLEQQISLLRVIQEKKVMRIGGDRMIPVNVRLICATNKNLRKEVEKGSFRQDLFYRLNVVTITIPPLRDRREDIPLLFTCFMEKLGRDRRCSLYVEPEVMDCLQRYNWPGNVRELQNVVERAASLAETGVIALRHLPVEISLPAGHLPAVALLPAVPVLECREQRQKLAKDAERHRILTLLDVHAGNVSQVARELGVSRKTLYDKMRRHSIRN
ncbi:sigma-54-dependent Fis family transcriptional regulator [Acetonema longum]|uniref:Acetoin operon expression regulatory protein n=1 Tax=Acetonema longum DSM 6540 TaxID=1009370 RepID=F7NEC7_9FIRM|nr:sigma-54-dependent Fis family transcriptional regulator [Acetonema longum]EGO65639.1 acetoin operon expression regulatory protein [Acetonema longum DSM 6540]